MKIKNTVTELIGGTPLLRLANFERNNNLETCVFAKVEFFNLNIKFVFYY